MKFFSSWVLILALFAPQHIFAQNTLLGKVITESDNVEKPIGYASISTSESNKSILADSKGNFRLPVNISHQTDSLIISSVGYSTFKMPLHKAINLKKFVLEPDLKTLDDVSVNTFKYSSSEGSVSEVAGFFRGWSTRKNGGEIGKIIEVNSKRYKLEKIKLKLNNQCDTCLIRVHVRDLKNGLPNFDLLDSTSMFVNKLSFDDKPITFDFTDQNIVLKEKYVFVSFEVLGCNNGLQPCSLSFIGTEPGNFLYRDKDYYEWAEDPDNSIYIRMYYKF